MSTPHLEFDIVIVGGGFAGVYCAKSLSRKLRRRKDLKLAIISDQNYLVFQPLLPEVAGASISPRHVVNPIRLLCRGLQVFRGKVESIDLPGKSLRLNAGPFTPDVDVAFKHLVLALGAEIDMSRVPGMAEHALLMQNVGDAMKLRATIIGRIEEANIQTDPAIRKRLLSFVVVGGGFSGVETAGQIYDMLHSIDRFYHNVSGSDFRVVLVHSRDHLLPTLSQDLGDYAENVLAKRGIEVLLNARVKSITANHVSLGHGRTVETATVVSTVGNAPNSLVGSLCASHNLDSEKGWVKTAATLAVPGRDCLWAAGDCALVPLEGGGNCPATAQFAMRQGRLLAENLARFIHGKPLKPFRFKGMGELASIGHRSAVANIFGFKFHGFFAWWLWRSVYLFKLPGFDRRLRVLLDWSLDLFFPRDINLLSPRYTTILSEQYLETGDTLFNQGEPAFSFYVVKSGAIEIRDCGTLVKTVEAGDFFGERALLENKLWRYDALARQPTVLIALGAEAFQPLVAGSESIKRLFKKSALQYVSRQDLENLKLRISPTMLQRTAGDIMKHDLALLQQDMSVDDALEIFRRDRHSSYPVVDDARRPLGVILREEFYDFIKREHVNRQTPLQEIQLTALPIVREDTPVSLLIEEMIRRGANKLLVADNEGRISGIVTILDLLADHEHALRRH